MRQVLAQLARLSWHPADASRQRAQDCEIAEAPSTEPCEFELRRLSSARHHVRLGSRGVRS